MFFLASYFACLLVLPSRLSKDIKYKINLICRYVQPIGSPQDQPLNSCLTCLTQEF